MGHIPIGEIFVPLQRMPRIMSLTDQKKSFFSETNTFICLETSLTRCEAFPFIYFYLKKKRRNTSFQYVHRNRMCVRIGIA